MNKLLIWNQKLGKPECPYMRRWVFNFFDLFSVRLHNWFYGDDPRAFHDHPWDFVTIVLKGSYTDLNPEGKQEMDRWTVKFRKAEHKHTVETKGCWTLLFCGPTKREWGFFARTKAGNIKFLKHSRYFRKHGHHPCQ
jgi:hypothetical protein